MVSQRRFLVADDDPDMSAWLGALLSSYGAVVEARDGGELLCSLADDGPFDLVVSDLNMPRLTGLQVCAMARTAGLLTPFLLVTAHADGGLRRSLTRMARVVLVEKPLRPEPFLDAARRTARLADAPSGSES